jgi:hypothetical protein
MVCAGSYAGRDVPESWIQRSDPGHGNILLVAKVNVQDAGSLLVHGYRLDQASVPFLKAIG